MKLNLREKMTRFEVYDLMIFLGFRKKIYKIYKIFCMAGYDLGQIGWDPPAKEHDRSPLLAAISRLAHIGS